VTPRAPTGADPCRDWAALLEGRAAGLLEPAQAGGLEAHLAACDACRAESAALDEALALAALPPPSEAERRAMAGASREALRTWKRSRRRWRAASAAAVALAVAAAAVLVAVSPGLLRRLPPPEPAVATWEVPDLDQAWETAAVADLEADDVLFAEADAVEDEVDGN
jgi:anti-sigma factor RsiW